MSADWVEKSLGDILLLQRGHDLPNQSRADGCVPIMGSAGLTGYHNIVKANGPGVVVGRSGNSMGEVHYTAGDYWPLNTALYVKDFKGNDERFIYYLLKTINFDQFNSGSAQKSLNRNAVHPHRIFIPNSLEEQKRIAKILADLENKIELNRQINQTLEHIAQTIFKSWFVDFEPVKAKIAAKAAGRDPDRAAMCAISGKTAAELDQLTVEQRQQLAATATLFPDELVDSELGVVPMGWAVTSVSNITDIAIGKTPPRKESQWFSKSSSDIRWISIRDMGNSGVYALDSSEYLTAEAIEKFNVRRIPDNTVMLSFKMTIGRVAISVGELLSNEAIAHFKLPQKSLLSTEYLYLYLKQFDYNNLGSTSSIANAVNSKTIKNISILIPKIETCSVFNDMIKPLFDQLKSIQRQNSSLVELRDTLLPKLLSGEILPIQNIRG